MVTSENKVLQPYARSEIIPRESSHTRKHLHSLELVKRRPWRCVIRKSLFRLQWRVRGQTDWRNNRNWRPGAIGLREDWRCPGSHDFYGSLWCRWVLLRVRPAARFAQGCQGPRTAFKWYQSGCRTLGDVRMRKGGIVVTPAQEVRFLPMRYRRYSHTGQQIGIRFYDGKIIRWFHIVSQN